MYIDGGTGSMLFQAVAVGFFSCLVFSRQIISKLKKLLSREKND